MSDKNPSGAAVLPEIKDPKSGVTTKAAGRLSVGRWKQNRVVVLRFEDHGAIYHMSPATARRLAKELKEEANALMQ